MLCFTTWVNPTRGQLSRGYVNKGKKSFMAPPKRKRATTSSSPRRRRSSNKQGSKKFTYYAVLLVIGAAAIVFYDRYITPLSLLSTSTHAPKPVASKAAPKNAFVEPEYQFYTLLPQGNGTQQPAAATAAAKPIAAATPAVAATTQNTTPVATATPAAAATPVAKSPAPITTATPTPIKPPSHHYALQLAAFRNYQDADELKAKLILQGYPTTISNATVNGTVWYRLSIGPYSTTAAAKIVQAKLEKTHLVNHTQVVQQ
jgi:cell division septation protein DedD